jgi:hypothetical protein
MFFEVVEKWKVVSVALSDPAWKISRVQRVLWQASLMEI